MNNPMKYIRIFWVTILITSACSYPSDRVKEVTKVQILEDNSTSDLISTKALDRDLVPTNSIFYPTEEEIQAVCKDVWKENRDNITAGFFDVKEEAVSPLMFGDIFIKIY